MKWKFLGVMGVMMGVLMLGGLVQPAMATGDEDEKTAVVEKLESMEKSDDDCNRKTFLFFKPWYAGICEGKGEDAEIVPVCQKDEDECKAEFGEKKYVSLQTFVWTIVLNVIFDLTLAIGYIAMVMMVYGGYLYIMSQGDPAKMAKGKRTLVTAITGVVLGLTASVLVNTAIGILGINRGTGIVQDAGWTRDRVNGIFNYAYSMAGILAVIFIIKSGIDYMLAAGDPAKTSKATRNLIYSVVGLVIVILAAVITNFVVSSVTGAL